MPLRDSDSAVGDGGLLEVVELLEKIQGEIEAEGQAEAASYDKSAAVLLSLGF